MTNTLFIGNKNYSSWSLRPWLVLRWAGIPFEERELRLDQPGYGQHAIADVLRHSPNGRVPCLHTGDEIIWDSLAIAEWAAERAPAAMLWPDNARMRAEARAITAEMHSGFECVRRDLTMNILRRCATQDWLPETRADLARIESILGGLRERHADTGPWLFGRRSIADAFYAPVATRLRTYSVPLSAAAQSYCDAIYADTDFRLWESGCVPNSWDASGFSVIDKLYA